MPISPLFNGQRRRAQPVNEPVRDYPPGSPERASIKARLASMAGEQVDVPLLIGGTEIRTGDTADIVMPHDHAHVLGRFHRASADAVRQAVAAALAARDEWAGWPFEDR